MIPDNARDWERGPDKKPPTSQVACKIIRPTTRAVYRSADDSMSAMAISGRMMPSPTPRISIVLSRMSGDS